MLTYPPKIVVFRNRGKLQRKDIWLYNNEVLDIVDEFNYLGMMFNYNGKFSKTCTEQGRTALFSICAPFHLETQCAVFDTYVTSVLMYASEIWVWHKSSDVEKVHVNFCREVLGAGPKAAINFLYSELGRVPLSVKMKLRIFKYWRRSDNCVLKACYEDMISSNNSWIRIIKEKLSKLDLYYLWETLNNETMTLFTILYTKDKSI